MDGSGSVERADRHPGDSYEDILNRDSRPVPSYLREGRVPDVGVQPVAASRYFDRAFFEKEARFMWSRIWHMACREEDIPAVGDHHLYEVLGKSLIVVRTSPTEVKALYNSCLHRGRKLVTHNGCKDEFKCPYHGFTWHADGRFKENPIAWDFPQWKDRDMRLPEAKVDRWGGFIFVNFDANAKPLAEFIGPLAADFERFDWESRTRTLWIQKKVRCNWKVLTEAFMESHHSFTTHPQILGSLGDANSQYDLPNDYVSRHFSASGVSSPFLPPASEQEVVDFMLGRRRNPIADADKEHQLSEGDTARRYMADLTRRGLTETLGYDYDDAADAEMLDALLYNLFPNLSFWAGHGTKLTYRWRPNGLDPETSIMDIMMHGRWPKDQPRPKAAAAIELDFDETVSSIGLPGLEGLAAVFDQDFSNLPHVHEGLRATGTGEVHFGRYSEMRIRHLHHMIDRYIAEGEAASTAAGAG
ncbi:MAG: aromatic ring-hydroxylating dioxygenase subunit alpha [Phenylobacterium sp.]|uniref:aromatic ring-hydroxylating oxygenase subunit alpha n=1 Tax=Phenylobacterium sp. TaxID=1871053 RepID=UPI0011FDE3EC|nr:aromatic ring-hydroxylating dioxygenase subunit alpha [Phenylobacterium sp.]TAJ74324.1 MAG: aromatic ring-hydroxylating dioxygenase subunit alpha [Phenylobacterium sp.]